MKRREILVMAFYLILILSTSSNANDFYVQGGSSIAFYISGTTGNIGISTISPGQKLVVLGNTSISQDIYALQLCDEAGSNCKDISEGWSGGGDVVGPSSATDNAIVRFDQTTGKLIQNSGVTIDDANNISGAVKITAADFVCTNCLGGNEIDEATLSETAIEAFIYDDDNALPGAWSVTSPSNYNINFDSNTFFLNATGNDVAIGTANPKGTFHVYTASAGSVAFDSSADDLIVENSANGGISIITPDASVGMIYFGSPTVSTGAGISWGYSVDKMVVATGKSSASIEFHSGAGSNNAVIVEGDGDVGIGLTPTKFDFEVAGNIGPSLNNKFSIGDVNNTHIMDQDLSNADASFWGEADLDGSGSSVEVVGDVNGDGLDDFLIGASGNDAAGLSAGQAYLFFGKSQGWWMDTNLSKANASFWGEDTDDRAGNSVSGAGDVNGDGLDDFLIGAYQDDDGGSDAGQTYLIFGKRSGWAMDMDLSAANASFWGEDASDFSGYSVGGAGDVNGDGFDDILIGAYGDDDGGSAAGQTYLILGKSQGWSMDTDLSVANASFWGEDASDRSGIKVSGVGDVNGDDFEDFMIGADWEDDGGLSAGQTYLILGRNLGWAMDTDLSVANASFWGESSTDYSGGAFSGCGDVNADAIDDFIIGSRGNEEGGSGAGQTYLFFGKRTGWSMDTDLSEANASFLGEGSGDASGTTVSGAGDVNGDGIDDFLIGAQSNDAGGSASGQTYLILGKAIGWSMDINLSMANASFWGEDADDSSGYSVSGAGDVDGNGFDDILISATGDDDGGSGAGQTYLILSHPLQYDTIGVRHVNADTLRAGDILLKDKTIKVNSPLTLDATRMNVEAAVFYVMGNVGVGVSSPGTKLDVAGTVTSTGLTVTSGTVSLPNSEISSTEVSFNYATSSTKGGDATGLVCASACVSETEIAQNTLDDSEFASSGITSDSVASLTAADLNADMGEFTCTGIAGGCTVDANTIALGTDTTGFYAASTSEGGPATSLSCTGCVAETEIEQNTLDDSEVASGGITSDSVSGLTVTDLNADMGDLYCPSGSCTIDSSVVTATEIAAGAVGTSELAANSVQQHDTLLEITSKLNSTTFAPYLSGCRLAQHVTSGVNSNTSWNLLDFTACTSTSARQVYLRIGINATAGTAIYTRYYGHAGTYGQWGVQAHGATAYNSDTVLLAVDANQLMEYKVTATGAHFYFDVLGYIEGT